MSTLLNIAYFIIILGININLLIIIMNDFRPYIKGVKI